MSKQDFLQRLREALIGEIPGNVIEENMRYYDGYISGEVSKGMTEEEVTASIGDPRLIAKTIIDASENVRDTGSRQKHYNTYTDQEQNGNRGNRNPGRNFHFIDLNKWYWKLLGMIVVVLLFFLVASIISGIFSILIPFMGPILVIVLIFYMIRGPRR